MNLYFFAYGLLFIRTRIGIGLPIRVFRTFSAYPLSSKNARSFSDLAFASYFVSKKSQRQKQGPLLIMTTTSRMTTITFTSAKVSITFPFSEIRRFFSADFRIFFTRLCYQYFSALSNDFNPFSTIRRQIFVHLAKTLFFSGVQTHFFEKQPIFSLNATTFSIKPRFFSSICQNKYEFYFTNPQKRLHYPRFWYIIKGIKSI